MHTPSHHESRTPTGPDDAVAKLRALIAGIDVAMFVTVDRDGRPSSRPMTAITIPGEGDLWFAAPSNSPVATQVRACADVTLHFVEPASRFVVVTGRAHLHRGLDQAHDYWTPDLDLWVPGRGDDIALIHVNVDGVEYWETPASAPGHLHFVRPVGVRRPRHQERDAAYQH